MLAYRLYTADIDTVPDGAFQRIGEALGTGFQPCIGPARALQANLLGIEPQAMSDEAAAPGSGAEDAPAILNGEIYSGKSSLFAITVETKDAPPRRGQAGGDAPAAPQDAKGRQRISVFYMGPAYVSEHIQSVKSVIETAFGATLMPKRYGSKILTTLHEEGRTSPQQPTAHELTGARVLSNRLARTLAQGIRAAGGLLQRDLSKQLPADAGQSAEEVKKVLERAGLISADVVVVCSRTQAQVARFPSRDVLQQMSARGVRCGCGRAIAEEQSVESIGLTDFGNRLLDGSRWLTVLLVRELLKVGVSLDDMLVEQHGGDEVDCVADIGGELVFFSVQDKDCTLGDAYAFGSKLARLRPEHSVLVCTGTIGQDAREQFDRAQGGRRGNAMRQVEGLEALGSHIEQLAAGIYQGDALRFLRRVLPLAGLKPQPLIQAMEQRATHQAPPAMPAARPTNDAGAEPAMAS